MRFIFNMLSNEGIDCGTNCRSLLITQLILTWVICFDLLSSFTVMIVPRSIISVLTHSHTHTEQKHLLYKLLHHCCNQSCSCRQTTLISLVKKLMVEETICKSLTLLFGFPFSWLLYWCCYRCKENCQNIKKYISGEQQVYQKLRCAVVGMLKISITQLRLMVIVTHWKFGKIRFFKKM